MAGEREPFKPDFSSGEKVQNFGDFPGGGEATQTKSHRLFDRAPTLREIGEREIVFAIVSGSYRQYTKIKGVLKYLTLS